MGVGFNATYRQIDGKDRCIIKLTDLFNLKPSNPTVYSKIGINNRTVYQGGLSGHFRGYILHSLTAYSIWKSIIFQRIFQDAVSS